MATDRKKNYYHNVEHNRQKKREAQARYKARHPDRVRASQRKYAETHKRPPNRRCALCGERFRDVKNDGIRVCRRRSCRKLRREIETAVTIKHEFTSRIREYLDKNSFLFRGKK